jgi:hypothetical protein
MAANLIYYLRSDVIAGAVAGQSFSLPTNQTAGADLGLWSKVGGLNAEWEVIDYNTGGERGIRTDLQRNSLRLRIPEYALTCNHYLTRKSVALVHDGDRGFLIHGWPPCNMKSCVAVIERWDDLLRALISEGRGSILIV